MTIAWVLGSGGLLGSALCSALQRKSTQLFVLSERLNWNNQAEITLQLRTAVSSFSEAASNKTYWQIYWAAGVGTMHSSEEELLIETKVLSILLNLIQEESGLASSKGCFIFASSAGAIYAGSTDDLISENTFATPTTDYARAKLNQEDLVSKLTISNFRVIVILARISTLYGVGQATGKKQGLVAEIARRILRNQPINIYVAFDTIRDYINTDDAASVLIFTAHALREKVGIFTKIVASENPVTIAEIIAIFKRISRRSPKIVARTSMMGVVYTRRIQFHSVVVPFDARLSRTSLLIGISQVLAAERLAFARKKY